MSAATIESPSVPEASPAVVVKLYDLILGHVAQAAAAAHESDFQGQFDQVMSATRIIDGLNRCLDMERGGDVARNMRDMYESVSRALMRSIGKAEAEQACATLISALRDTRNAWAEISGVEPLAADKAA